MILGLGCDIINIERIAKSPQFLERFKQKILGSEEQDELNSRGAITYKELACRLAKSYAAKEAFVKALGTGFRDGIFLKDIQILHTDLGKPELFVSGMAFTYLQRLSVTAQTFVTLSDDYPFAQAVVVIEK